MTTSPPFPMPSMPPRALPVEPPTQDAWDSPLSRKAALDLGWPALCQHLVMRCHTVRGGRLAAGLFPLETPHAAMQRQAEVSEARALQDRGEPLVFAGISDVALALDRSAKGGVLDPGDLVEIGHSLLAASRLRRHILLRGDSLPRLRVHADQLVDLPEVAGPIADAFDEQRALKDTASPALGGLRQRVVHLLAELTRRTDSLLGEAHIAPHLMDRFVTQREDRYVVPVRADARTRVKGIVHGTSASGATLFVEPEEVIDLNNRLKLAQLEVTDEERRILTALSLAVERAAPQIAQNLDVLADLDLVDAAARFAIDLRAQPVTLTPPDARSLVPVHVDLRNGRHPLMLLSGTQVVANDVLLPSRHTLIVSGPNAGGKTVALKLTGLSVLMARAGLHVPVQEGSSLPWFSHVLTDVGDDQSLEKNLSTFSAHVHNLQQFLALAGPQTLVLIDEIAVGTDPDQGAALAEAVLEEFARRGATVLVTTHYDRLKALGASGAPFANASVGYDLAQMAPTYRLHLGIPGPSSALTVAERLGLPAHLVARAHALLGNTQSALDRLMQTLSSEREITQTARTEAEAARQSATRERQDAERIHAEALLALRAAQRKAHDETIDALRAARRELHDAREEARLQKKRLAHATQAALDGDSDGALTRLSQRIDRLSADVTAAAPTPEHPPGKPVTAAEVPLGTRVYVPRIGGMAIVTADVIRDKVVVQAGSLRLTVDLTEILLPDAQGRLPARSSPPRTAHGHVILAPLPSALPPRTPDATLDLRGERAHIAVARAEKFLDDALREGRAAVFILHGHGTGILRHTIRTHFAAFPGIRQVRSAEPSDGGDGVTVLALDT